MGRFGRSNQLKPFRFLFSPWLEDSCFLLQCFQCWKCKRKATSPFFQSKWRSDISHPVLINLFSWADRIITKIMLAAYFVGLEFSSWIAVIFVMRPFSWQGTTLFTIYCNLSDYYFQTKVNKNEGSKLCEKPTLMPFILNTAQYTKLHFRQIRVFVVNTRVSWDFWLTL